MCTSNIYMLVVFVNVKSVHTDRDKTVSDAKRMCAMCIEIEENVGMQKQTLAYGTTSRGKEKNERTENRIFLSFCSLVFDNNKFILIDISFSYSPYTRNIDGTDSIDGIASSVY